MSVEGGSTWEWQAVSRWSRLIAFGFALFSRPGIEGTEIMQKLKSYLEALKREAEGRDEQMQSFWAESGRNIPFGLAAVHLDPLQSAKLDKLAWPFT